MEELRWKKLEIDVHNLSRRVDDQEDITTKNGKDIAMLHQILNETKETNKLIGELMDYARKTYEVFEPLAKILAMLAKIGLVFTFLWHGVKYLAVKLGFLT